MTYDSLVGHMRDRVVADDLEFDLQGGVERWEVMKIWKGTHRAFMYVYCLV